MAPIIAIDGLLSGHYPIIAMIAITKSFLGHYLGAREGFNGMVIKSLRSKID